MTTHSDKPHPFALVLAIAALVAIAWALTTYWREPVLEPVTVAPDSATCVQLTPHEQEVLRQDAQLHRVGEELQTLDAYRSN